MASPNLPICYTFVLRAEICTIYTPKLVQISLLCNRLFPNLFSGHKNCLFSIAFITRLDFKLLFQANSGSVYTEVYKTIVMH